MPYYENISKASAAAAVNGPEVLAHITRAEFGRTPRERLEHLCEALSAAREIVEELERAIAVELTPVTPQRAREICRAAMEG